MPRMMMKMMMGNNYDYDGYDDDTGVGLVRACLCA